jgi:hypothetical protein
MLQEENERLKIEPAGSVKHKTAQDAERLKSVMNAAGLPAPQQ